MQHTHNQVYEIVIYGGTSAGVVAAVQAARSGRSVALIEPSSHMGGMTSGGLGWTDSDVTDVIGGLTREFYRRVKRHYDRRAAWVYESVSAYPRYRPTDDAMWFFEPHVAERIFLDMLAETGVAAYHGERLDLEDGVRGEGPRILSIRMESGCEFRGLIFIDATYEGDLMAKAGVRFAIGREGNGRYGETLNGVQTRLATNHQFRRPVDPYVVPENPASGPLPGIDPVGPGTEGCGDRRLQAYTYRLCLTDVPENQVPFERPPDYEEREYELLFRNFAAGEDRLPLKIDLLPNRKTDVNNCLAVSTDLVGRNYGYPEAGYAERDRVTRAHEVYIRGLLWTLAHHPSVPEGIRTETGRWGWAKDEFPGNGNFPHQLYVREARRMVGDFVMTEAHCRRRLPTPAPVGMGSYGFDSHHVQRYVTPEGHVRNEGDVQIGSGAWYPISYGAIVPRPEECMNLLVPVCLSASHIAYGSIRVEPTFMILGQAAATAAALAIEEATPVQGVDCGQLRARLDADGQVLEHADPMGAARGSPRKGGRHD